MSYRSRLPSLVHLRNYATPSSTSSLPPTPPPPPFSQPTTPPSSSPPGTSSSGTTLSLHPSLTSQTPSLADPSRIYTQRKTLLYSYYSHLLHTNPLILLFSHDNLSSKILIQLRSDLKTIPLPLPTQSNPTPKPIKFHIIRTGLFAALSRKIQSDPSTSNNPALSPYITKQVALLTMDTPTLSPKYVADCLRVMKRTIRRMKKEGKGDDKQPRLDLVAGILEGNRLVGVEEVGRLGQMVDLDTARAQVVGMLEGQGRGLLGVLSQAGGGGLVRTLQGLEGDLKAKQEGRGGEEVDT